MLLQDEKGQFIVTYDNNNNAVGKILAVTIMTNNAGQTVTQKANQLITDETTIARIAAAQNNQNILARQSPTGSELTDAEREILTNGAKVGKSTYIDSNG